MAQIITRFPPSPTGFLHIGSARTALYNYLFAAHEGGGMILRFEDTDAQRSKKEYEDDIVAGLEWLKIPYTLADTPRQSQRLSIYQPHLKTLLERDAAYEAEEAKDSSGKKVIRFKNPNKTITFTDHIRGEVSFDTTELGDFVIAKNTAEPLYHLAVVIDDHEMGVTHVIRGEDHISNTPRQILILEALGFARPQYAHIPLILAPDRTKLSKRHGAVSVNEYRAQGFIREALLNYLALLGWNPGGEREIYSLSELAKLFTLEHVHAGGAIFDIEKLRWFNREHLKRLSEEEYLERLRAHINERHTITPSYLGLVTELLQERTSTLQEAAELLQNGEFSFMDEISSPNKELMLKGAKADASVVAKHLKELSAIMSNLPDRDFTAPAIQQAVMPYADAQGRGAVLWPLRVTLSGKERSPDPFTIAALIGKEKTLKRIAQAQKAIQ